MSGHVEQLGTSQMSWLMDLRMRRVLYVARLKESDTIYSASPQYPIAEMIPLMGDEVAISDLAMVALIGRYTVAAGHSFFLDEFIDGIGYLVEAGYRRSEREVTYTIALLNEMADELSLGHVFRLTSAH